MNRRIAILVPVVALVAGTVGWPGTVSAAVPDAIDDSGIVVQRAAAPATIDVLANDAIILEATIASTTDPDHGAVVIAGNGRSLTYAPDEDYSGPDTFDYTVHDPADGDDTATVSIRVNAPPVAADNPSPACDYANSLSLALAEDTEAFSAPGSCDLLANDSDGDGTIVGWELVTPPLHGDVTNTIGGPVSDFSYIPDPHYSTKPGTEAGGTWTSDSFTYRAVDSDGARSAPATVRLWIGPVNDAPTFVPGADSVIGSEDVAYSAQWATSVLPGPANETGQAVHFEIDQPYANAGLFSVAPAISPSGVLSFTPASNLSGATSVTFVAVDDGPLEDYSFGSGAPSAANTSAPVTIDIAVNAVNDPPVAVSDPAIPGCVANGNFGGSYPLPEDSAQVGFVANCSAIANDTDVEGPIVSWAVDTLPAHGIVEWLPSQPGVFGYTPAVNWSTPAGDWASDSFTYHVVDAGGASSNEATFRFWISPVNDAPTFTVGPGTVNALPGTPYQNAWATDVSPGPNEASQAVHFERTALNLHGVPGLFAVAPTLSPDGTLSFTAASGQTGVATVTFVAKDDGGLESYAGVVINPDDTSDAVTFDIVVSTDAAANGDSLTVLEDAATTTINVIANDVGPGLTLVSVGQAAKGTAAVNGAGTAATYRPDANANGADSFTYTMRDSHGVGHTATVTVTITAVNDKPNAVADAVTVAEDQATASTMLVTANDTDVEADAVVIATTTAGAKGAVSIAAGGGSVTYKPYAQAFGMDTFGYTISDGHGGTDTAIVTVTITPSNDAPIAANDGSPTAYAVALGAGPKTLPVLSNDSWLPDAPEALRIVAVTQGGHGTVAITGAGTGLTYTAKGTTTGPDLFTYTISDGHGGTDSATVQVNVGPDTSPPLAAIQSIQTTKVAGRATVRIYVRWMIVESGAGITTQQFQRRTDSGAWGTVILPSVHTRTVTFALPTGHTYSFRVRATDRAGNVGAYGSRQVAI